MHQVPRTGFLLREANAARRTRPRFAGDLRLASVRLEIPSRLKPQLRLQESKPYRG